MLIVLAAALGADDAPPPPPTVTPAPVSVSQGVAGGGEVAVIRIEGMIYGFTLESLQRRTDRAIAAGATVIVIELDTPGGMVISALKIAKYIKADIPVPTVAWVHNEAYSAGILIASACDQIVMSPASTTGDCAPIVPGTELAPTERAKALSPILEEFRDNAQNNGYDYAMFHAMCVLNVEVYLIEHEDTKQRMLVNQADHAIMVEGKEGKAAGAGPIPVTGPAATQPVLYGVSPEVATEADRGKWKKIKLVHDGKTLLTVNQNRAVDIGLSQSKDIRTDGDLSQFLGANSLTRVPQTWSEDAAGWLTSPWVRAILVLALLLGAYVEFQSPGLGAPGAVAVAALVVLIGAPFLIGLAEVWHILVFMLGVVLILVELLVIPGFGVFGVSGLICMFVGLVMMVVPAAGTGPLRLPPPEMMNRLYLSTAWMVVSVIASGTAFFYLLRHFEHIPLLGRMVLQNQPSSSEGAVGDPDNAPPVSGDEAIGGGRLKVGATGRTTTELRPSGRAQIDEQTVDVVTPGNFIEPGRPIKIIEVHGNRIIVDLDE